jgi:RimJ/RimL family protein N-acetyltransferase
VTIREPICGGLVCLAPLSIESVPDWVRWMTDADTTRYLYAPGDEPPDLHTSASLLDWGRRILADPARIVFALTLPGSDHAIGDARLGPIVGRQAKFSIMIGEPEHRGHGLGTEATRMVCEFGFEKLGLREIKLQVDPRNRAAVRAYLSAGFEQRRGAEMRLSEARWAELHNAALAQ